MKARKPGKVQTHVNAPVPSGPTGAPRPLIDTTLRCAVCNVNIEGATDRREVRWFGHVPVTHLCARCPLPSPPPMSNLTLYETPPQKPAPEPYPASEDCAVIRYDIFSRYE